MPEFQLPLSYDDTLVLLREVIAEKGEGYIYRRRTEHHVGNGVFVSCFYVEYDQPSCIVGHVLHRAGVPIDDIRRVEGQTPLDVEVQDRFDAWADGGARWLLNEVQANQDEQHSWGESLRLALEAGDRDG